MIMRVLLDKMRKYKILKKILFTDDVVLILIYEILSNMI